MGLAVLGAGAASSTLLRVRSDDHIVLTASSLLLTLCVNVLIVYRRYVNYYLVASSFFTVVLLYPLTKFVGVADRYLDLVDLGLVALLLFSAGYYWLLADMSSLFKAHTPIAVLVSTFAGIYLGLKHPVRLALLTVVDALASLVLSSGWRSRVESATAAALFFVLLYASPITAELRVEALAAFAALYLARSSVVFSDSLRRYRQRLGDLVSLDMVLKPLLAVVA